MACALVPSPAFHTQGQGALPTCPSLLLMSQRDRLEEAFLSILQSSVSTAEMGCGVPKVEQ